MELLKTIFKNIDFHLNAQTKTFTLIYSENRISLRIGEDGKIHFDTILILDGPRQQAIDAPSED